MTPEPPEQVEPDQQPSPLELRFQYALLTLADMRSATKNQSHLVQHLLLSAELLIQAAAMAELGNPESVLEQQLIDLSVQFALAQLKQCAAAGLDVLELERLTYLDSEQP